MDEGGYFIPTPAQPSECSTSKVSHPMLTLPTHPVPTLRPLPFRPWPHPPTHPPMMEISHPRGARCPPLPRMKARGDPDPPSAARLVHSGCEGACARVCVVVLTSKHVCVEWGCGDGWVVVVASSLRLIGGGGH